MIIITVDAIATTVTNKFLCLLYVTHHSRLWDPSLHLILRDMVTDMYQQYYSERDKTPSHVGTLSLYTRIFITVPFKAEYKEVWVCKLD